MSAYNYGYGTPAAGIYAAGQTYPAASYAAPTAAAAAYGYATSQPAARAVPVYQATTYATSGFAQPTAVATAAGGYGYFQRAGEPAISYTAQKTSTAYALTQASYGYGTTASTKTTYASTVPTYIKPQTYVSTPAIAPVIKPSATSAIKTVVAGATADHKNAYEKVVFNAATSFLTQQSSASKTNSWNKNQKPQFRLQGQKGGFGSRPAGVPPKPQQLHYCEVCKISCAGPQTYKEHLEGQKHKKKATSAQKEGKLQPGTYKCELCDVICTGRDAYAAHVKGGNHQKVVKLHQKLGKPIPEVKLPEPSVPAVKKSNPVKTTAPKINFVGGSKLVSATDGRVVEEQSGSASGSQPVHVEEEAEPVGEDQVEDVKSDVGKVIGYKCNLCDCRFNDIIAKNAHCKGRKHRLQYKKKIDPSLVVHIPDHAKRNSRGSRLGGRGSGGGGGANGAQQAEMVWRQRQQDQMRYWTRPDRHRMHELEYYEWERRERYMDPPKPLFGPSNGPVHGPDDKLVMAKHEQIYPDTDELAAVQSIVQATEKALKLVSDSITDEQKKPEEVSVKEGDTASEKSDEKKPEPLMAADNRVLKGVMRVGVLAKGLLLKGQLNLELVVLCAEKPTYTLLKKVGKLVPEKLKEVTDEKLNMSISVVQCAILITSTKDPKVTVKVTLTSPSMREGDEPAVKEGEEKKAVKADPKDVLDKEKCLQALAALRHAKWFQARANQVQSCVITIRILRELCQREAAFKPLQCWPLELVCEKALASYPVPIGPGEAFRRVMEALASGILLEGGSGVLDPCEKEMTDTAGSLTSQEREGITAAAQNAVRLQAFRQLHKVLGVDPLQPVPRTPATRPAKRTADVADESAAGGKAAKKEESA